MPMNKSQLQHDSQANTNHLQDAYYGDLRKGAYLKRRAEYRMQVSASASAPTYTGALGKAR